MNKYLLTLLLLATLGCCSFAQEKFTVSGYVRDAKNGESLFGANVYDAKTLKGTTTNQYGFFSITLPSDSIYLTVSYVGFGQKQKLLLLNQNLTETFELTSNSELKEVEIVAVKGGKIEERTQMSTINLSAREIKALPRFFGEVDVLRSLQLLPGIQSGNEGSTGIYVRGGSPDQNLILLDGVPVYNASHLFGFFSTFNADAINNVNVMKGGFPARYGGRLSSVIEVNMKEGNMNETHGKVGVGLIASNFTIEGPIKKDKASYIISARRTYLDILAQPLIRAASDGEVAAGYYFYDLTGKANYKISDKDRLYFSFYGGRDKFYARNNDSQYDEKSKFSLGWGNITSVMRWNHEYTPKLFSNYTLNFSRYQFDVRAEVESPDEATAVRFYSGIRDWMAKADYDYLPNPNHYIKFGGNVIQHRFKPGATQLNLEVDSEVDLDTALGESNIDALEYYLYAEDDYKVSDKLKVNVGLHYSGFWVDKQMFHSLQPRISGRYLLNSSSSLKLSYARMAQFIHLLTNPGIGLPTDLWVPSTALVMPEKSDQIAAGYAKTLGDYEVSVEAYYKQMQNIIEYKDGQSYVGTATSFETKVSSGTGWSYGGEFLVQKKLGDFTGWVGYTLSWTNRQFADLNQGKVFPYRYDRRHDISVVLAYQLSEKIDFTCTWVYGTGNAVTLAEGTFPQYGTSFDEFYNPTNLNYYPDRNNFRMASYHRMDIGVNFKKEKKRGVRTWNISVFNVYNRKNPFFLTIESNAKTETKNLVQYSLFPIIPSISYNYEF